MVVTRAQHLFLPGRRLSRILLLDGSRFAVGIWILWLITRVYGLLALHGIFPYQHAFGSNGDVTIYYVWARTLWHGVIPYRGVYPVVLKYPPGMLPILALPPISLTAYQTEFLCAALVVDGIVLRALLRSKRRSGAVMWVLSATLLGPIFWSRLDIFVAAMLVAAVLAFDHQRYGTAAFWIAFAALVKIWPVLLVVVLIRLVPRDRWRVFLSSSVLTLLLALSPFVAMGGAAGLWNVVQGQSGRSVELESLFALPLYALSAAGHTIPVVLSPASFQFAGPTDAKVAAIAICLLGVAVAYCLWRALLLPPPGWDAARWVLLVAAIFITFNQVLSPQYLVWTAAAVAVFVDECAHRTLLIAATGALLLTTQAQFPFGFPQLVFSTTLALPISAVHAASLLAFATITIREVHIVLARSSASTLAPRGSSQLLPTRSVTTAATAE